MLNSNLLDSLLPQKLIDFEKPLALEMVQDERAGWIDKVTIPELQHPVARLSLLTLLMHIFYHHFDRSTHHVHEVFVRIQHLGDVLLLGSLAEVLDLVLGAETLQLLRGYFRLFPAAKQNIFLVI